MLQNHGKPQENLQSQSASDLVQANLEIRRLRVYLRMIAFGNYSEWKMEALAKEALRVENDSKGNNSDSPYR